MASNVDTFLTDLLIKLLDAAHDYCEPSIPSDTLRRNLTESVEYVNNGVGYGRLYIDQYWALWVHDGRSTIAKAPLIWFRNPTDDPRLAPNGVLTRYSEWSSLTPQEFRFWAKRNREARRNGTPEPMVVVWTGVKGVVGSFFFDNDVGMAGFLPIARNILDESFREWLEVDLGTLLRAETDAAAATV